MELQDLINALNNISMLEDINEKNNSRAVSRKNRFGKRHSKPQGAYRYAGFQRTLKNELSYHQQLSEYESEA